MESGKGSFTKLDLSGAWRESERIIYGIEYREGVDGEPLLFGCGQPHVAAQAGNNMQCVLVLAWLAI